MEARTGGGMRDVWREVYPDSSLGAWVDGCERERLSALRDGMSRPPDVQMSLGVHGHTCDSVFNTWRWSKQEQKALLDKGRERVVGMGEEDPRAKRLDYIFVGDGRGESEWMVKEVRLCMTERHPDLRCSLSDHFAVEAVIERREVGKNMGNGTINNHSQQDSHLTSGIERSDNQALYTTLLSLIATYTARSRLHRRRRLTHFLLSVLITLACFVAVWFSPRNYVSFLLLLLSSLGLMAGSVDGLIGLLFGGSELRALKEWEWNVRNTMREEERKGKRSEGRGKDEGINWEKEEEEEEEQKDEDIEGEWGRVRDWWD